MKRSMHKAADRLADDTAGVINDGGQALVWFWKAGWSLAALLLTAATAAAWWIRRQPDALRARQRLERTRLRDRDRRAAQSPAEFH